MIPIVLPLAAVDPRLQANAIYSQLSDRYQRLLALGGEEFFPSQMNDIRDRIAALSRFLNLGGPGDVALEHTKTVYENLSSVMKYIESSVGGYKYATMPWKVVTPGTDDQYPYDEKSKVPWGWIAGGAALVLGLWILGKRNA